MHSAWESASGITNASFSLGYVLNIAPLFPLNQYKLKTDSSSSLQEHNDGFQKPIPGLPGTERKIKREQSPVNEVEVPYKTVISP